MLFRKDDLLEAANCEVNLTHESEDWLDALLEEWGAAEDIEPLGRRLLGRELLWSLEQQAALRARRRSQWTASGTIVIAGLPRSGTTLLHNLLGLIGNLRTLKFEDAYSIGRGDPDTASASAYLRTLNLLAPGLQAKHPIEVGLAEECITPLQATLASERLGLICHSPGYLSTLSTSPIHAAYEDYRLALAGLGSMSGKSWVLKAPTHSFHLPELQAFFPEMVLVRCWRDPIDVVPSFASLALTLTRLTRSNVDEVELCRFWMRQWARGAEAALDVDQIPTVVDVWYPDLLADPVGTVESVCRAMELSVDEDDMRRLGSWVHQRPADRHGTHTYSLRDFGVAAEEVRDVFESWYDHRLSLEASTEERS